MKTFIKNVKTNGKLNRAKLLVFTITMLSCIQAMAEDSKALQEAQEKAAHSNMLSYIFMVVGFIAVISIAWFFRKTNDTEVHEHHPHPHPHHPHNAHDKRYGTSHTRHVH